MRTIVTLHQAILPWALCGIISILGSCDHPLAVPPANQSNPSASANIVHREGKRRPHIDLTGSGERTPIDVNFDRLTGVEPNPPPGWDWIRGDPSTIRSLLESKPTLSNKTDEIGWTPLHWSARLGLRQAVAILLDSTADINAKDHAGFTPLHVTLDLIPRPFDAGSSRDQRAAGARMEAEGASFSVRQLGSAHKAVLSELLRRGADVNSANDFGDTPLHIAAVGGHYEMIPMLLDAGANCRARDSVGRTPEKAARDAAANQATVRILVECIRSK